MGLASSIRDECRNSNNLPTRVWALSSSSRPPQAQRKRPLLASASPFSLPFIPRGRTRRHARQASRHIRCMPSASSAGLLALPLGRLSYPCSSSPPSPARDATFESGFLPRALPDSEAGAIKDAPLPCDCPASRYYGPYLVAS